MYSELLPGEKDAWPGQRSATVTYCDGGGVRARPGANELPAHRIIYLKASQKLLEQYTMTIVCINNTNKENNIILTKLFYDDGHQKYVVEQ